MVSPIKGAKIKKRLPKPLIITLSVTAGVLTLLAVVIAVTRGRVMPNTNLSGQDVSWQKAQEVQDRISSSIQNYLDSDIEFMFEGETTSAKPVELGLQIDTAASIVAFKDERVISLAPSSWARFFGTLGADYNMTAIASLDRDIFDQEISKQLGSIGESPVDAQLTIANGKASIRPEQPGSGYSVETIAQKVIKQAEQFTAMNISVETEPLMATTTSQDLLSVKGQATALMSELVIIKVGDNQYDIQPKELGDWLIYNAESKVIQANDQKINQTIDRVAAVTDQPALPKKVISGTSEVIEQGTPGLELDRAASLEIIKQEFFTDVPSRLIELPTKVDKPEQIFISNNAAPSSNQGKIIRVVLSEQKLYVWEDGKLIRSYLISSGLPGTPTPIGTFTVKNKIPDHVMSGPGYYLPHVPNSMYFEGLYALHGAYWHNDFGNPRSHGCINLPLDEAEWLINWAQVGTPVEVGS